MGTNLTDFIWTFGENGHIIGIDFIWTYQFTDVSISSILFFGGNKFEKIAYLAFKDRA
jgi:hypothetical protein